MDIILVSNHFAKALSIMPGGWQVYASSHLQYGNMLELIMVNDIVMRYGHASSLLAKVGQIVRRGLMGTGFVQG